MKTLSLCFGILLMASLSLAQNSNKGFRPPAVPLVTSDPYFSVWSFANHPADDWTRHWTGANNNICGMLRVDGKVLRLLSKAEDNFPAMAMTGVQVLPTRTIYDFAQDGIAVTLTFTTPMIPSDLSLVTRPVTYLTWQVRSTDGKEHAVALYYDNSAELVVNTTDQKVVWSRFHANNLEVLGMGSQEQRMLEKAGDDLRIDWGYFFLASPKSQNPLTAFASDNDARRAFEQKETLPASDDMRIPRPAQDEWPVMACVFNLGKVGAQPVERHLILAYDDRFSIEYFQRKLRPYWRKDGAEAADLLDKAERDYAGLTARCRAFDEELMADMTTVGGRKYAQLAALAYRQAIAANKLAVDLDGTPLLFPKENFSNGCIATVDVIYPAAPIFLLFNADLMKATITPVLEYARAGRWHFPFAPHDLGTYPLANGQVYGGGEKTEENQMPVEESGNMLILVAAIAQMEENASYALPYKDVLARWAAFLKDKGLDPENQLCTDDFAGHLAHNVNLSLKAIVALGGYSRLCEMMNQKDEAKAYRKVAEEYAARWEKMARDGDHYRLAFDKPGTWSQKYNLVWDKLLGLNLFPPDIARREVAYYKGMQNRFGLPLDNRKDYTKLDWTVWSATLAESQGDFESMIAPLYAFADQTESRVPLTDWFDTKTGKQIGFQARSVVGGVFIKMLADKSMWHKWSSRAAGR